LAHSTAQPASGSKYLSLKEEVASSKKKPLVRLPKEDVRATADASRFLSCLLVGGPPALWM